MKRHRIYARHRGVACENRLSIVLIRRSVRETLRLEGVDRPCEANVLITNDRVIQRYNREFRKIDKPTDVLSFPSIEFSPPGWADPGPGALDADTGLLYLGDIVLSSDRVRDQAIEYGFPIERETAYLTAHAALHLLGYDHIEASDKKKMRERERAIMKEMGLAPHPDEAQERIQS